MFSYYSLFASTIFLSSFLLFLVQPLIGKHILPWYGGSSAVWITALLFFMVALAVGYIYALGLSRLRLLAQVLIHGLFSVLVIGQLWLHTRSWVSAITPRYDDLTFLSIDPTLSVFLTLLITIGLPFTLLSSTSSLLQFWYARLTKKDPASLYSISNVGSLLGLLSYPFVVEPLIGTSTQGQWWTIGMAFYLGLLLAVLHLVYSHLAQIRKVVTVNVVDKADVITPRRFLVWTLVASVPVMALMAGTSFMTTSIAPIPLLWVGPLSLYLISFIWSFRERQQASLPQANEALVIVLVFSALSVVVSGTVPVAISIVAVHFILMALFHVCHEHLYASRPQATRLPSFYVALSLGGIWGSLVIKASSLWFLNTPIEFSLLMMGAVLVILYRWYPALPEFFPLAIKQHSVAIISVMATIVIVLGGSNIILRQTFVLENERNFFGHKAVKEFKQGDFVIRALQHGQTSHGFQATKDGVLIIEPTSYYGTSSGISHTFSYLKDRQPTPLKVAVIGLGTGALTSYCEEGDEFLFMEIDPQVISLAWEQFNFLERCAGVKIVEADGRLALAELVRSDTTPNFDLIVIDAYADDMVPVHLMTAEAIGEYKKLLTENGVIAIHISSRYLDLLKVAPALASANQMSIRHLYDKKPNNPLANPSNWLVLAQNEQVFSASPFSLFQPIPEEEAILWTDTYSALLPIIKLW